MGISSRSEKGEAFAEAMSYINIVGKLNDPDCPRHQIYDAALYHCKNIYTSMRYKSIRGSTTNTELIHPQFRIPLQPKLLKDFISAYETDPNSDVSKTLGEYVRQYLIAERQLIHLGERLEKLERAI